jgi:DNA-binding NarL/FixJ family response regulator
VFRILLADDHAMIRRGVRHSLSVRGEWTVCGEAQDGNQAVRMAQELVADLVLLDLRMPVLHGLDATRLILKARPGTEVLIFTFVDDPQARTDALAAGAHGYLLKGDPPEHLIAAVDSLSRHIPYFAPERSEGNEGVPSAIGVLSPREVQVLRLIAGGKRTREISGMLGITDKTVESHRASLARKLNLDGVAALVRFAVRNGLVDA